MVSESKGMFEASSHLHLRAVQVCTPCPMAERQAQTGTVSGQVAQRYMVFTQMRPGVKHHPTVTENGPTERDNPLAALVRG